MAWRWFMSRALQRIIIIPKTIHYFWCHAEIIVTPLLFDTWKLQICLNVSRWQKVLFNFSVKRKVRYSPVTLTTVWTRTSRISLASSERSCPPSNSVSPSFCRIRIVSNAQHDHFWFPVVAVTASFCPFRLLAPKLSSTFRHWSLSLSLSLSLRLSVSTREVPKNFPLWIHARHHATSDVSPRP